MSAKVIKRGKSGVTIQIQVPLSPNMLQGEEAIQRAVNEAGLVATQELLDQFDTDGSPVSVAGRTLTSKGQLEKYYQTPYGEVQVARHVYQDSRGGATFCPLEAGARIIVTSTPRFAKSVSSKYAEGGATSVTRDLEENHGV